MARFTREGDDAPQSTSKTAPFDELAWLAPVGSARDLPREGVREGMMCFVDGENAVYQFRGGAWTKGEKKRRPST